MNKERVVGLGNLHWQKVGSAEWTAENGSDRFRANQRSGDNFDVYATTKILGQDTEIYVGRWSMQLLGIAR